MTNSIPREHDDVFSLAGPKFDDIFWSQFQVSPVGHLLPVQLGAIGTLQVDQVGFHLADFVAKLVPLLDIPELNHCVLLADAGVLGQQVNDCWLSPHQPAAPGAKLDRVDDILALEHEKLPLVAGRRLARLWRFVIFQRDRRPICLRDRIRSRRKMARGPKVGFLFWFLGLFAVRDGE